MRIADLLLLSLRMLKTRFMRTLLTVLGVSVGIGAILFLVSLGYGLQHILLSNITSSDALLTLDVTSSKPDVLPVDDAVLAKFKAIPNVAEISPIFETPGRVTYKDLTGDVVVNAVDGSFFRLGAISANYGHLFTDPSKPEVVVSTAAVKLFSINDPRQILNEPVSVKLFVQVGSADQGQVREVPIDKQYAVVGVIKDDSVPYIFFPINQAPANTITDYQEVKVKVKQSNNLEAARQAILALGYSVSALSDTIDQANKIFRVIQVVLGLFGVVALAVSAIGMFNTMTIALLERTQEIGIFRALGAARHDVSRMFLVESALIGFLGGIGGIALGLVGGKLFNLGLNFLAHALGGEAINLFFTPFWFVITISIFSTVIGFLTGIFPARRAARLNPLVALRYK